jgi:hypothetical protein
VNPKKYLSQKNIWNGLVLMWRVAAARGGLRMSVTMTVFAIAPMRSVTSHAQTARCVLSPATVTIAARSNMFSESQLEYMQATQTSSDPRDVVWHRAVTKQVNPTGAERDANNRIMHALDDEPPGRNKRCEWQDMSRLFNRKK